ncbi:acyl-CoA dehydrogenase family protein [Sulfitobacter sabulilitoris]|uniref:Pimeloyl-CoA dehydrogenase small subunit n=1 Tax=Sulfitobacter sabulilitoris TaxID=2562655 RepID=A0A5S3PC35_9RHOB|nr:acyl-CoA dehydrogenase [Sulfitobacter sabulilitoris]TMM51268.1 pimeloyl-CoA dehydrogenase small subunit [Sulfitobacter sabulilitoris]
MNFDLTEERQMLQDSLRRFLRDRYTTPVRNEILESDSGMSAKIWEELAELGVIGALFTEEQGGFGGAGFDIAVVFEELGRAGVVEPFLDTAVLGGGLIAALGNDDQQAHVEEVIGGALHLAFAHGEPASRYDLNRVETTAKADGDSIVLNGRKAVVVNAEAAGMLVVSARESGDAYDTDGISLFLVPADAKGVSMQGYALLAGGRAAEVTLDDVTVPASARLGDAGKAFDAIEERVAAANVAICAETLGAMETATHLTREYLGTRKQFGRPIGSFQALAHRMSDLLIEMEQARSSVILAAGHLADDRKSRESNVSAAKNLMGRTGRLVAEDSIQMHGGIAMTQEYELAHIAKRIVMADHRLGDTDHHLERFIALSAA